jgi:hypothetical protein
MRPIELFDFRELARLGAHSVSAVFSGSARGRVFEECSFYEQFGGTISRVVVTSPRRARGACTSARRSLTGRGPPIGRTAVKILIPYLPHPAPTFAPLPLRGSHPLESHPPRIGTRFLPVRDPPMRSFGVPRFRPLTWRSPLGSLLTGFGVMYFVFSLEGGIRLESPAASLREGHDGQAYDRKAGQSRARG